MQRGGLSPPTARQGGGVEQAEGAKISGQQKDGPTQHPSQDAARVDDVDDAVMAEPLNAGRKKVELHRMCRPRLGGEPL
ncbi:hypothetical protein D3C87_1442140 [compost metagenome]